MSKISSLTNLTSIDLFGTNVILSTDIKKFQKLTSLNLKSSTKVRQHNDLNLLTFLPNLSKLNLAKWKGSILDDNLSKLTNLTALDLSYHTSLNFHLVWSLRNLTDLDISYCPELLDYHLEEISSLENLRRLNLSNCPYIYDGISYLANLPVLRELDLRCSTVTPKGLHSLKKCPSLVSLHLDDISDAISYIKNLVLEPNDRLDTYVIDSEDQLLPALYRKILPKTIVFTERCDKIKLIGMDFSMELMSLLCQGINSRAQYLVHVDILSCFINVERATQLGNGIKSLSYLQSLNLKGTRLARECLVAILDGLHQIENIKLKFLGLEATAIGCDLALVCDAIHQGLVVRQLCLKENQIGDNGAELLGQLLGNNLHLTQLILCGCNISDLGLMSIIEGVLNRKQTNETSFNDTNQTLFINLLDNPVTKAGVTQAKLKMPPSVEGKNYRTFLSAELQISSQQQATFQKTGVIHYFNGSIFLANPSWKSDPKWTNMMSDWYL